MKEVLVPVIKKNDNNLRIKYDYLFKSFEGLKVWDINLEVTEVGAEIRAKYGIRTPDSLQVGCAIWAGYEEFLSSDRRLGRIGEIKVSVLNSKLL